ncbi:MAG TPA: TolC family protein [Candidatus Polarisedimenticolaceae bacterium]|nr:TolC family protein [Candidatus Polarisedimenticolaceae bacterium]
MREAVLPALVLVLASSTLPPETITFDEAVRRGLEHNRDVAEAAAAILRAEALLQRARSAILPSAEVVATETVLDEERGFGTTVVQPKRQFALRPTATVPVLVPAAWAARTHAKDQVHVAQVAAADVRKQVAVSIAQAYLEVIAAGRQLEVDRRARDTAQAQVDYADTRLAGGAGSKLNALRAAEVLQTDQVLLERSQYAQRLAQEALGVLVAADKPLAAIEEPEFSVPPPEEAGPLTIRTDIALLSATRDAAERLWRDSWKEWLPRVEASFDPAYVDPAGAFEQERTWRAQLELRVPLYSGGALRAERNLRAADYQTAQLELEEAELRARSEARSAREAVEAAIRGEAAARQAADHAAEVLNITDIAFHAGATTNIELIDAQRRARDSASAAARAADLLRLAQLELLVALGRFP